MDNLARIRRNQEPVYQQYAVVTGCVKEEITVRADGELFTARRAASCLVEPRPGDRVLACRQPGGDSFVLAVLEAAAGDETVIAVEGDLRLNLDSGHFTVAAQEGIDMATAGTLETVAGQVKIDALRGRINLHELIFKGARLQAGIERVRLLAASAETVVQRLVQRAKRVFRTVEEDEIVRAGRVDVSASKTMSLSGKYTVMTARQDVKIDGERIHIG